MKKIYKFALPRWGSQAFHGLTKLLSTGWQGDDLKLWAEYDDSDSSTTIITVAFTGEAPPANAKFIGTAVGPVLVAHVYARND